MSKKKKTYKKKYTTKDRLDMSKGGRVGYQRGGPRRPVNKNHLQEKMYPEEEVLIMEVLKNRQLKVSQHSLHQ